MPIYIITKKLVILGGTIETFSCDEERITASSWEDAESQLKTKGLDNTHEIQGELMSEGPISDDVILDLIIDNKLNNK